jgi:hypothetical protein
MSKNFKTFFTLRRARVKNNKEGGIRRIGSATKSDFNAARSKQWKLKNYAFCLIALTRPGLAIGLTGLEHGAP